MRKTFPYPTHAEAKAFAEGVEFVNDSAIDILSVEPTPDGGGVVTLEDHDAHDDTETDDQAALDAIDDDAPVWGGSSDPDMVRVTFQPQAWVRDHAVDVDPEGPTSFLVPRIDTLGMTSNRIASDRLQMHINAPAWIRAWHGPFYFTLEETP